MALSRGYALCEKPVADALLDLLKNRLDYLVKDGEAFFSAEQNARIVTAAEQYYGVMYYGDAMSWNLRDQHMFDTLERLLAHRGSGSKAVVWAHNSHIGNAEFTEMAQVRGEHRAGRAFFTGRYWLASGMEMLLIGAAAAGAAYLVGALAASTIDGMV